MRYAIQTCPFCDGPVVKKKLPPSGGAQLFALLAVLLGITLVVLVPCVGWVLGPIIILAAIIADGKRRKVLACKSCKAIITETA